MMEMKYIIENVGENYAGVFGANIILVSFQSKEEFSKENKVFLFSIKM